MTKAAPERYAPVIQTNVPLVDKHTFGLDYRARTYAEISSPEQLKILRDAGSLDQPFFILGGGSNAIFTADYEGLLLRMNVRGVEVVDENEWSVWVRAGAGENWHEFVEYCVSNGWGGLENLALIPGTVGAAPVQNIGAYGVELADVFESAEGFDAKSGMYMELGKECCGFGYRDSVFKRELKGRFFITHATLRLSKQPEVNLSYGALRDELARAGIERPTIKDAKAAVCRVRRSKLPDPVETGNAGSFFKNPVVPAETAERLRAEHPGLPVYPQPDGRAKLAAGWLIDQCGWKGRREGGLGVWPLQALVLVRYGAATGPELRALYRAVRADVETRFGVRLEREINIVEGLSVE